MQYDPDRAQSIRIKCVTDQLGNVAVYDAATGARLWGVRSVIIQARAGERASAIIRVENVEIEMQARVDEIAPVAVAGAGAVE